jgi:hypothetical protein
MKQVYVGQLVVVNDLPDATLYRVVELAGKFNVGLIDSGIEKIHPNQRIQWIDKSCLQNPTNKQLEQLNQIA